MGENMKGKLRKFIINLLSFIGVTIVIVFGTLIVSVGLLFSDVSVSENMLTLRLKNEGCGYSEKLIESFRTHLGFISEEFPRSIQIITK